MSEVRSSPRTNSAAAQATAEPLGTYIRIVVALGALAIIQSAWALREAPSPYQWLLFAAFAVATGTFTMKVASIGATVSVSDTFFIASVLLFGPAPPTLALAIASSIVSWRRRHSWKRVGFNAAAPALSIWIASHAFFLLARVPPLASTHQPIGTLILPLLSLTVIYFLLNSGFTAVAIGLDTWTSPLRIWREHFFWLSLSYLAAGSVSFCLILLIQQVSFGATAVVIPLLIIFHLTLRSSFGRLEDARTHLSSMDRLYLSTIETLAMAIDAKDDVTHSHVRRVQAYALALAEALGITDESSTKAIKAAALLHDTGKLAVPEHILNKPGGLTASEFEQMKLHVDVGADILSLVDFPYPVVPIVRGHHENWDGSGYPRGTAGQDIPIGARILSVVDCFDALTSDRPYRKAMTTEAAIDILRARRGTMYDPQVVDVFIAIHRDVQLDDAKATKHEDVLARISRPREALPLVVEQAPQAASNDVLAFVSLARMASGQSTLADVLALASKLIHDIVPGSTAAWYIVDATGSSLVVADASGPAADQLRGLRIAIGDRLTGWVAANRQAIVNSDPALDLGARAARISPALQSCLSAPLASGDALVGVLTLYAADRQAFSDDQGRLVQMIAPHLAQAIARAQQNASAIPSADDAPSGRGLRLIASR
jgi:putative nucleotidyltransferase with HDIG domain